MSQPWHRGYHALLFLLPAGVLLLAFVVLPMSMAFFWGCQNHMGPEAEWVGPDNYRYLAESPLFRRAFGNTALFALMVVPVQTTMALLLALWVNRRRRCWRWLRVPFFVPVVVSMPVLAVLWKMLYSSGREMGLVNLAVQALGLPPQPWLEDPHLALPAIAFMSIWQGVGFQMMIFLAALQHVQQEQIEAALLDGAGPWARLVHVILPAIRNSVIFAVVVTTIFSFRLFAQPYLMTQGGPEHSTYSIIQWIYVTGIKQGATGLACAAALLFLVVVGAVTLFQRLVSRETTA